MIEITQKEIAAESKRVSALRMQMLEMHPFWGYLLLQMRLIPALNLPTFASTDTINHIWYNPALTQKLAIEELGFVLAHEVCHQVLATSERQNGRESFKWNLATDYAINAMVNNITIPGAPDSIAYRLYKMPPRTLYSQKYHNWIAEAIYEDLCRQALKNDTILVEVSLPDKKGSRTPDPGAFAHPGIGLHLSLNLTQKLKSSPCQVEVSLPDAEGGKMPLPSVLDHHGGIDLHLPLELNADQQELLQERIEAAVENYYANSGRGDLPEGLLNNYGLLGKPKIPWQRILHRYVDTILSGDDYSLARPNKHYWAQDLLVPGHYGESISNLVVALDTSGSMTEAIIQKIAKEIRGMVPNSQEVTLIVADCAIQQVITLDRLEDFLKSGKFRGGGGTNHLCVFKYIKEQRLNPRLFIGLTDLYTIFPEQPPPYPVLWLVPEYHGEAQWGKIIEI